MALGWPVGEVLGSEADLLERYQVSRAVFREAVRLVEHQQVARTRRGPGGGLVITEPTIGAVIDAVVLYLHRVGRHVSTRLSRRASSWRRWPPSSPRTAERADEADLAALGEVADHQPVEPRIEPPDLHRPGGRDQPECLPRVVRRRASSEVAHLYSPERPQAGRRLQP